MSAVSHPRYRSGFTLIELLVAIAVFSFLATAMYTGVRQIVIEREILLERTAELNQLQRAVRYLQTDLSQLHPRSVRDELGRDRIAAIANDPSQDFSLQLSRDGWRNPALAPRGSLQRVQYRLEDEALIREHWPVMDRLLGDEPRQITLIEGVEKMEIAYLDNSLEWQPNWPPPTTAAGPAANAGPAGPAPLPRAIRYRITLESYGEIERLVEVVR